ncbi:MULTISPECIES: monofunctional biosynthetic peptidoglycan transglycosylase [unclassified Vibrio]|uniref:Biosynthetic peptidoglycan transglycosylase n=1 Tax=Vibrio sp. HB236076 TaxID=3232307 RepID=A0AB39HJD2_9VIBR|nr:monofunctional biosynthetic peptidoglycan transglycosylase [Vibrio sp. HB161653]MDP5254649.1 monofunctional biosynthetic peptidoglycan transglycosylase [Vibrio sp. HB161653]
MFSRLKSWLLRIIVLLLITPVVLSCVFKYVNPPIWGWQINRTLFPPSGYPDTRLHQWRSLDEISSNLPLAVIASEDQTFLSHWGVDVHSLLSVIKESGDSGPQRGASTITQQTAKNVFLFPSHSYLRKAYELYIALLLELIWGKERIMEVYLNVIEFGPGIYGVEAASQHYFSRSAHSLSRRQAAQLAVVLPNPYRMKPTPMSQYVYQRTQWVLRQMRNLGAVSF